uniref:Uncharacterized protein n=1 Tax=Rhizobium leguminosarum bv. viciae TaxID=387 RepID=A0A0U3JR19_RHILV|nr:hypothetical protein [Rhizobium leguminosarum bv. viciae]
MKIGPESTHIKEVLLNTPLRLTESGFILQPADPDVLETASR